VAFITFDVTVVVTKRIGHVKMGMERGRGKTRVEEEMKDGLTVNLHGRKHKVLSLESRICYKL
jgi:hypothetical protein